MAATDVYSKPSTVRSVTHVLQMRRGVSRPTHCLQSAFWHAAQRPIAGTRSCTKQFNFGVSDYDAGRRKARISFAGRFAPQLLLPPMTYAVSPRTIAAPAWRPM